MKVICLASALYQGYLLEAADSRLEVAMAWPLVAPADWKLRLESGRGQPVDLVRRRIVRRALMRAEEVPDDRALSQPWFSAGPCDAIVWADHDVSYSPSDVVRLVRTLFQAEDIGIVAAPMPQQERANPDGLIINVNPGNPPIDEPRWTAPFLVQSAGFGLTAIKSTVFERVPEPWFQFVESPDGKGGHHLSGEDMGFCDAARAAGFRIVCEPRVRPYHTFLRSFSVSSANEKTLMDLTRRTAQ